MMCEGHFSGSERLEVVEIHHHPQLLEQCCDILNMEWPRSKTVRLRSLMMSCDSLPTCLVLVQSSEVLGHSKLSPIPGLPLGCVIHSGSIVVHPEHRGKGLGKFLMAKTEECAKRG
ncbi:N-alpha-acetyltransferase 80 isoform X5 [Cryptotermes secundus]|uniref:N-alpha-acetyltransferase 80 isoform X5 n=1 Tax=Cryptotermes secundus TaxID=105785 RepID=UPI000CD7CA0D|nr:N-alpha-acetyltransferase 80 isoform X5 [Cryptotermes secundus]